VTPQHGTLHGLHRPCLRYAYPRPAGTIARRWFCSFCGGEWTDEEMRAAQIEPQDVKREESE
jgi:hypothetical protein